MEMEIAKALQSTGYHPFPIRVCHPIFYPFHQYMAKKVERYVVDLYENYFSPIQVYSGFYRSMFRQRNVSERDDSNETLMITLVIIILFKLCGCCQMIHLTLSQELLGNYPHPDEQQLRDAIVNKFALLSKRAVKMAGYWLSSFFCVFMD